MAIVMACMCTLGATEYCSPLDVAILVDRSNSISETDYVKNGLSLPPPSLPPLPPSIPPSLSALHLPRTTPHSYECLSPPLPAVLPFVKVVVEGLNPHGSGSTGTRVGLVVFPGEANGKKGDVSGTAKTVVGMTYSRSTLTAKIDEATGSCDTKKAWRGLHMPCDDWGYTPIWDALQRAEELLCTQKTRP